VGVRLVAAHVFSAWPEMPPGRSSRARPRFKTWRGLFLAVRA
jgi:hypothetical protein